MRSDGSGEDGAHLGYATVIAVSAKAIRVKIKESGETHWIPSSVIHDDSEVFDRGHEGELVVKQWWAEKEGLS